MAAGASATEIADAALAIWMRVHAALAARPGRPRRCRAVQAKPQPYAQELSWFESVTDSACENRIFGCLAEELSQHPAADAAVANGALLQTFNDLLATLVGASLTRRLLEPVWVALSSGAAAQARMP